MSLDLNIAPGDLMSHPVIAPPAATDESGWLAACFANSAYARIWKAFAGLFLIAGILALLNHGWYISADLQARRTWPTVDGQIVSAEQRDDSNLSLKAGSLSSRTRYWIEYEVKFAATEDQCRTGIIYSETMPCHGIVRTRSTQSTYRAYEWLLHGHHRGEPVKVLYNPNGPEVKIVGESIWLRYNFDRLILNIVWVIGFFALYAFAQRRLEYFKNHPEALTNPSQSSWPGDRDKLTDLNLS